MQIDKLLAKMKRQPNGIKPQEIEKVLTFYGYKVAGQVGSHRQYRHKIKRPITVVQENPVDRYIVKQVLQILEEEL